MSLIIKLNVNLDRLLSVVIRRDDMGDPPPRYRNYTAEAYVLSEKVWDTRITGFDSQLGAEDLAWRVLRAYAERDLPLPQKVET